MTVFDVDAAIRWAKLDPNRILSRRRDDELPFIDAAATPGGQALLLDTCVYIDQLQGRTPGGLDTLVEARVTHHSTVAIQELMHTVGVLRSDDRRTPSIVAAIRNLLVAMPPHRIVTPDDNILGRAALLAGMLCRLQGFGRERRLRALHDCVLFLQAQKFGMVMLTANVADFDVLLQLVPKGRVLFYRRA